VLLLPKVTSTQQHKAYAAQNIKASSPFADKKFLFFVGIMLLFSFCFFQLFTTVPLYFKEALRLSEFTIGCIMAMNGIFIALFEMIIVFRLEGSLPYLRLIMFGTLLLAFGFMFLNVPLPSGILVASLAMFIVTVAEIIAMPFMNTWYLARTAANNRGQYAALYTMSWSCAQVVASLIGTSIAYAFGFFNLWCVIFVVCLLAAGGFYYLFTREKRV
jgi:predicted MFS family arabinose efflux permease